jgi:methionine-R-sulfoxide reductase
MTMLNWKRILSFAEIGNPQPPRRDDRSEGEWRKILTDEQFHVTRKHGTERPFTGEYCASFDPGLYGCVCCGNTLFDSELKFESGTGWPSFTQPVEENAIRYIVDRSYGMVRVETLCNVCDAHLGHVFPDGPAPSRLRYCMNSVALKKLAKQD